MIPLQNATFILISTDLFNKHVPLYAYVNTYALFINNMWIHVADKWKLKTPDQRVGFLIWILKPHFIAINCGSTAKVNSKLACFTFWILLPSQSYNGIIWMFHSQVATNSAQHFTPCLNSLLPSVLWIVRS